MNLQYFNLFLFVGVCVCVSEHVFSPKVGKTTPKIDQQSELFGFQRLYNGSMVVPISNIYETTA